MEQTTLYFRQGSSDKVYQANVEQQNGGYVVNFAFGRRGTTLQTGTKTQSPVSYDEAKRIFDKLVNELRQQMMGNMFQGLQQGLQGLTPEDLAPVREMVKAIVPELRTTEALSDVSFFKEGLIDHPVPKIDRAPDFVAAGVRPCRCCKGRGWSRWSLSW